MGILKHYIRVTVHFAGLHYWSKAEDPHAYLANPHRHTFIVTATKQVTHADRQIEFFAFEDEILKFIRDRWCLGSDVYLIDLDNYSCEQIASEILTQFDLSECWVSEDGQHEGGVRNVMVS